MKTGKTGKYMQSPLQKYIDESGINMNRFARLADLPFATIQRICKNYTGVIHRYTAIKICNATNGKGKLSLQDFGIAE